MPVHKACIINTVLASLRLRVFSERVEGRTGGGDEGGGGTGWFRIDPSALSALPARTVEKVLHLYSLGHPSSLNVSPASQTDGFSYVYTFVRPPLSDLLRSRHPLSRGFIYFNKFPPPKTRTLARARLKSSLLLLSFFLSFFLSFVVSHLLANFWI